MPLSFVNINGAPVDPASPIYAKKKKASKAERDEHYSRGLCVCGFSPEMILAAEASHGHKAAEAKAKGKDLPAFTVEAHIKKAKPKKLPRRFHIAEAAQQYAQMLSEAGWVGVEVKHDRPKSLEKK
jgi:hypothetical protein